MSNQEPPEKEDPLEKFRRLLASEDETLPEPPEGWDEAHEIGWTQVAQGVAPRSEESDMPTRTPTPPGAVQGFPPAQAGDMPLPRRVDEVDLNATRVSPAAYSSPRAYQQPGVTLPSQPSYQPVYPPVAPPVYAAQSPAPPIEIDWRRSLGCLLRSLIGMLFGFVALILVAGSILLYQYYKIAATLPNVDDLKARTSQFETTRILDRSGRILYEILDPNAGRRTFVPLSRISPMLVAATIATEDKEFYNHPGYDPLALLRALWQNYTSGKVVSGASTITQQLARNLLFSTEERYEKTYTRKAREIILAAEITRRYSKDEILELYLNESYYGNLAYGIEAAAETYFGTTADKLTLGQAAFLAGLPQAPAVYDVYTNRDATLYRQQQVLVLMYQLSEETGCIYVSNSPQRVCIDPPSATVAANELKNYNFQPPSVHITYPHWVQYVRGLLEEQYDPQTIYRSGFTVTTTIDPVLQEAAQQMVSQQVALLADKNVSNGALVAIKPSTGEILAMVGSADFYNEAIDGQVNMAVSPTRQPGSSIKPLNYVAAFEKGWTPATLLWDVPSEFPPSGDPNDPRPPYKPVNYDGRFHGPVTVRTALANSYNVPAVKTLQFVGIYDDPQTPLPEGMIAFARRLGITSLTRSDYGLALTLGGGEVSLLEMTGAFAVFANGGRRVPPVAILKIVDYQGNLVYEYQPPAGEQVVRPEHAFLISSILSDNEARTPMFGRNSVLALPFPAAAKTGTTDDFRDNWTLGYTPDLAVGVWVGNADYTPMVNTTGLTGAAPIWSQFMQYAVPQITGGRPTPFIPPNGIVEKVICEISGTEPSQWCKSQRREYFAADQPPLPPGEDLWRKVKLDTWTGLEASPACPDFTAEQMVLHVEDEWAQKWLKSPDGKAWLDANGFPRNPFFAPKRECRPDDPHPTLAFTNLVDNMVVGDGNLDIFGIADGGDLFAAWQLDYGIGENPKQWFRLNGSKQPVRNSEMLYSWNLAEVPNGIVTLRLTVFSTKDGYAERLIRLEVQNTPLPPSPTPEPPTPEPPTPEPPTPEPPPTP
ncbi:MAG: transglycosylase domain-containing protein [Candidatus Villigracilaceae bacterium]